MKRSIVIYLASPAFFFLTGCQEFFEENASLEYSNDVVELLATVERHDLTKTIRVENGGSTAETHWEPGDQISLFFKTGTAGGNCFTTDTGGATASFSGTLNAFTGGGEGYVTGTSYFWGVYPYMNTTTCDNNSVTLTIPSTQPGRAGSFSKGVNISIGKSENLEMAFMNLCSGLSFSMTKGDIKSAVISSNNGEPLVGRVQVEMEAGKPVVKRIFSPASSITLTPEEGSFVPGEKYYVNFIPTTLSGGFKITLYRDANKLEFSYGNSVSFSRSEYIRILDLDNRGFEWEPYEGYIEFEDESAEYACIELCDKDGDGKVSYAEAASVNSLSGLFRDFDGVETFPELVYFYNVTDLAGAFTNCSSLREITIPDNITTVGTEAFKNCISLTEIVIPSTVSAIGREAFAGCTGLNEITILNPTPCSITAGTFPSGVILYVPDASYNSYRLRSVWKNYEIYPISENLSFDGTANCYIVDKPGLYMFRSFKGNSDESVGEVASVEVLWESFGSDVAPSSGSLVRSVRYLGHDRIFFNATDLKGNALIAAKDQAGTILWSWHIWMTDKPEDQVYRNDAGIMMDRNLGATSNKPGLKQTIGTYYQWGRKDPFVDFYRVKVTPDGVIGERIGSTATEGTIEYSIQHPTDIYGMGITTNGDWYYSSYGSAPENTRWMASDQPKALYDPCPPGYRVPDGGPFTGVWYKACGGNFRTNNASYVIIPTSFEESNMWNQTNQGINFGAINHKFGDYDEIWYPCYDFGQTTLMGYYWTATPVTKENKVSDLSGIYSAFAMSCGYASSRTDDSLGQGNMAGQAVRALKCLVRCAKDTYGVH